MIQYLSNLVDESAKSSLNSVREIIDTFPPTSATLPVECLENTKDGKCMQQLLEYLTAAKEDSQQRSWQIFDDHVQIEDCLVELTSILVINLFIYLIKYTIIPISCKLNKIIFNF